nr:arsenate reductase (glutaredoxin) [Fuerstiella marisgermanici]
MPEFTGKIVGAQVSCRPEMRQPSIKDHASMTTIYHNPRCSKSRSALELLQSRGIPFEGVKYLDDPPDEKKLGQIVKWLGIKPEQLVRKKEKLFAELQLGEKSLSDKEWIAVLAANPKLIERPIVVHGKKAAIGRPLENISELLDA